MSRARKRRGTDSRRRSKEPDAVVQVMLERAVAAHRAGRLDAAESGYRGLLDRQPGHPDGLHLLGVLNQQRGRPGQAERLIRRAIVAAPGEAAFHANLAEVCRTRGRLGAALEACERAAAHEPERPGLDGLRADLLLELGRPGAAAAAYRRAIEREPNNSALHNGLGNALAATGAPEQALAAYDAALAATPDDRSARLNSARALAGVGQPDAGLRRLDEGPADADLEVTRVRAELLEQAGRMRAAAEAYAALARGAATAVEQARWLVRVGVAREHTGDAGAAEAAYRDAVRADRGCAGGWQGLLELGAAGAEDLRAVERLRAQGTGDPEALAGLELALGARHEAVGEHDRAFAAYRSGNARVARRRPFDAAELSRYTDAVIEAFDVTRMANAPSSAPARAIFIVGMPRSGTTLVERMLAGHPRVTAAGEREDLRWLAGRVRVHSATGKGFPEGVADLDAAAIERLAAQWRERAPAGDGPHTDKLPSNYLRIGLIRLLLPEARIVHCRRDPRDTCVSCYTTYFARGQSFTFGLDRLASAWREYDRLMAHWREVMPEGFIEVDYERLVEAPEPELRRVLAHCGLDWQPECLAFHARDDVVKTASRWQVRQPLYRSSVGRWRRFARHIAPLLERLPSTGDAEAHGDLVARGSRPHPTR